MCLCKVICTLNQANKTIEKFDCLKIFFCRDKLTESALDIHDTFPVFEIEFNYAASSKFKKIKLQQF